MEILQGTLGISTLDVCANLLFATLILEGDISPIAVAHVYPHVRTAYRSCFLRFFGE